jgi:hypothetical protein
MATAPKRLCALAAAALLAPTAALADDTPPGGAAVVQPPAPAAPAAPPTTPPDVPATRRSGFTVGLMAGVGLASIVGYPNDVTEIGYAGYYTATGARPGTHAGLWIGGALTDWFTFGLGFQGGQLFATGQNKAKSQAGAFHIEVFPLFALGGHLRDLGVMLDAGFGTASVTDPTGNKLVDSSAASLIGAGVFYEGIRLWKIGMGPFLLGNYIFSDTALRPGIFAGWRAALYTGP